MSHSIRDPWYYYVLYDYNFETDRRYLDIALQKNLKKSSSYISYMMIDSLISNLSFGKIEIAIFKLRAKLWEDFQTRLCVIRLDFEMILFVHSFSPLTLCIRFPPSLFKTNNNLNHLLHTQHLQQIGFRPKDRRGYLACFCADTTISSQVEIVDGKYLFT